ncbi:porin family protein [Alteromonas sediminis]|uniref:Porin family protein n=1 Tax=Alteromonas sediminis TaxID=2259342 RepID=A0A3N5Y214_9ALTE|nr:OmpW family outer membrane protein [Alteromonas sediminis]RPJ66963.1 porin family protein [Alteromonas sediminis]
MKQAKVIGGVLATAAFLTSLSSSAEDFDWYLKPTFGLSTLSDQSGRVSDVLNQTGAVDVNLDAGLNAGLGVGYFVDEYWAVELYWEYRSNDSETILPGDIVFTDGNFASSMFALNTSYYSNLNADWRWFIGAGIAVLQEIDIDLEDDSGERSFSGSGDLGFQIFAGIDYELTQNWSLQAEVRYLTVSGIDMVAEENVTAGVFQDFDYTPISLQANLTYKF